MKENFNVKGKDGAIAIFVLVGLLFMTSFFIISYGYNVNKSKIAKEQHNIISDIYSHKDGDVNAYERAYTALRKKNKQTLTKTVENSSTLELERTYEENLVNYRIYGNDKILEGTQIITEFTNQGFLPSSGAYPDTTDTRFPNAKYEIINIKKGQTFKFDYTGINEAAGEYTTIGYIRVRCIDEDTNEVVCDLVHNNSESVTETDYYITNLYYTYSKQQTDDIDGYVTAKKDFKIGIMYLLEKPDNFKLDIYTSETVGVGDRINLFDITSVTKFYNSDGTGWTKEYSSISDSIITSDWGYFNQIVLCNSNISNLEPGTYTISADIMADKTKGDKRVYVRVWDINDNKKGIGCTELATYQGWQRLSGSFTVTEEMKVKGFQFQGTGVSGDFTNLNIKFKNIQLQKGNKATEYVSYNTVKIPIKVSNEQGEESITNINMNSMLMEGDYIDLKKGKVVRNDGTEETIKLPEILMNEDYTKIEVLTEVKPAKIEVEYVGYTLE